MRNAREKVASRYLKSRLAQTMQWMGLEGLLRMVHTANVLGVGRGTQSKHSVDS